MHISGGYIGLFRCLLEKPIWTCSTMQQKVILITLLLMASHKEKEWEWEGKKFKVKPGQFVTSLDGIAKKSGEGISIQNVRTALARFEKLDFLTNESTKTGRLVTILNWHLYQVELLRPNKDTNKDLTKTSQRPNKDLTTIKNVKNVKNVENKYIVDFFESVWNLYPRKEGKGSVSDTQKEKLFAIGYEEIERAINRYKDKIRIERTETKYIKQGSTFFNSGYVDYLDCNYTERQESNINDIKL